MLRVFQLIQSYWKELLIAILIATVSVLWWRDHQGLVHAYDASTKSYEQRIEGLKSSYEKEVVKKDEALSEYKKRITILENERQDYIEELENSKADRKVELINLRRGDPDGFILKIETQFGFEHVE